MQELVWLERGQIHVATVNSTYPLECATAEHFRTSVFTSVPSRESSDSQQNDDRAICSTSCIWIRTKVWLFWETTYSRRSPEQIWAAVQYRDAKNQLCVECRHRSSLTRPCSIRLTDTRGESLSRRNFATGENISYDSLRLGSPDPADFMETIPCWEYADWGVAKQREVARNEIPA